jgi:hypothetical protein
VNGQKTDHLFTPKLSRTGGKADNVKIRQDARSIITEDSFGFSAMTCGGFSVQQYCKLRQFKNRIIIVNFVDIELFKSYTFSLCVNHDH